MSYKNLKVQILNEMADIHALKKEQHRTSFMKKVWLIWLEYMGKVSE